MSDENGPRGTCTAEPWTTAPFMHPGSHLTQPFALIISTGLNQVRHESNTNVALAQHSVRAGIPIPPLNLQAASAQQKLADPWGVADHTLAAAAAAAAGSAAAAAAAAGQPAGSGTARSSTPRTPGHGSSRGDGGAGVPPGSADNSARGSSRSRQRYGAWYVAPKEWKTVYGNGGGSGAGTPSRGPTDTGMVAAGVAEGTAGLVPGSKEAELAIELGGSYTARVYREHLKANNMRTPGVLERVHAPTEDEVGRRRCCARADDCQG